MCGIIGIISQKNVTPLLVDCLKRLEYRGYDSAGIATLTSQGIDRRRSPGKINNLEALIASDPISGTIGIGHTRWATHGAPNQENAHPHANELVAVVHNGIIENFASLRQELESLGHSFSSDTDTEVVVHQLTQFLNEGNSPTEAAYLTLEKLHGAFALAMIFKGYDDLMICARRGSPLAIGVGHGEMFVGSDAMALAPFTKDICYLEENDWAEIHRDSFTIYHGNQPVTRPVKKTNLSGAMIGKGDYRHFMEKEIFEQPSVLGDALHSFLNTKTGTIECPGACSFLAHMRHLTIVACGTSFYAASVAKYWIEKYAKIPVSIDIASEFRYREAPLETQGVSLFISQSGETADTLAAMRYAKAQGQKTIAVVNVPESSLARECDVTLEIHAGPEIGVASTKAFLTQLMVLASFTVCLAKARQTLTSSQETALTQALLTIPSAVAEALDLDAHIKVISHYLAEAQNIIYLGRGTSFPIALEGALKLKEISYIHTEAYAAGELKHGPIALIDDRIPVVVIAPFDELFDKTISNVQEIMARGANVILITDPKGNYAFQGHVKFRLVLPEVPSFMHPILCTIPVQLLAYYTAVLKGTDVDQPRNLAKSVTVE